MDTHTHIYMKGHKFSISYNNNQALVWGWYKFSISYITKILFKLKNNSPRQPLTTKEKA